MKNNKASHVNTGVRKILEIPQVYDLWRNLVKGKRNRKVRDEKYFSHLKKGDKVLDIGCGTGALLDSLKQGIEYYGTDMEESYIEAMHENYPNRGVFLCEKVGEEIKEEWKNYFDVVNAHGLIHHLNDEDSNYLFEVAKLYLKPGGFFLTTDSVYHQDQSFFSKWLVSKDRGQNVKDTDGYLSLAQKHFSKIETELVTDHMKIPYSIFIMKMIK